MNTYNVYDVAQGKMIMEDARPSVIMAKTGMPSRIMSKYASTGHAYRGKYKLEIHKATSKSQLISVYDLIEGDYIECDKTPEDIATIYKISVNSAKQYASGHKIISDRYIFFRPDDIPISKILPEDLEKEWNRTMRTARKKAERVS